MSSVRGGGFTGRRRGSPQASASRGQSPARGGFNNNIQRGRGGNRGSTSTQPRGNTRQAPRGPRRGQRDGAQQTPPSPGAFTAARTRGSWQERYNALLNARERERADAIRRGIIADPEKPRNLSDAITPVGTCQDMCAEFERVQRVVQKEVKNEELLPGQDEPDEARMVKKFRRSAAGIDEQLPSDLRPPQVLKQTCDYLFDDLIGNASSLAQVHGFVWDRTRAIRNDFSIQQVTKPNDLLLAIECYERIARFHIASLHELAGPQKPYPGYDSKQEEEQLDKTLLSLMQYYDDCRGRINLPNEAEFRAYCVIFQLRNATPDLEDRVQTWPEHIIQDQRVQKALDLYMAACNVMEAQGPLKPGASHLIARQDWAQFWKVVASKQVSYLMACVAEVFFYMIRRSVINALFRVFRANTKQETPYWTVDVVSHLLALNEADAVAYCKRYHFNFKEREDGQMYLDLTSVTGRTLPDPGSGARTQIKTMLVEDKRFGRALPAVINGLSVRQAQETGMVLEEEDEEMDDGIEVDEQDFAQTRGTINVSSDPTDDGESLFMPESKRKSETQTPSTNPFGLGFGATTAAPPSLFSGPTTKSSFGQPSVSSAPSIFDQQTSNIPSKDTNASNLWGAPRKFSFDKPATAVPASAMTPISPFNFGGSTNAAKSDAPKLPAFGQPSTTMSEQSNFISRLPTTASPQDDTLTKSPSQPSNLFSKGPASAPSSFGVFGPPNPPPTRDATSEKTPEPTPLSSAFAPKPSSPEQPKSFFTFPQSHATGTPATSSAPSHQQPETRHSPPESPAPGTSSAPTSPTLQPTSPTGLGVGVKRASFSIDTKPKKPSPLSNSWGASDDGSAVVGVSSSSANEAQQRKEHFSSKRSELPRPVAPHEPAVESDDAVLARLANELVHDPVTGFLKQFIEYTVSQTITQVQEELIAERNNKEFAERRQDWLYRKYGKKWRDLFWKKRLAKSGHERRERRRRRLQQRNSQGSEEGGIFDNMSVQGRNRAESVSSVGSQGLRTKQELVDSNFRETFGGARQAMAGSKRPVSSHGTDGPVPSRETGHKRLKSTSHVDERGRVSKPLLSNPRTADILKRSSFLGFSVERDGAKNNNKDTTKSNYFRLKALGVKPVDPPNRASPRASPSLLRTSVSGSSPEQAYLSGSPGLKRRGSAEIHASPQTSRPGLRSSLIANRPTSNTGMHPPTSAPAQPTKTHDDDEALFARLRAARQQLKDSSNFLKSEIAWNESRKSSQSDHESPSMTKARAEARHRASQTPSEAGSRRDVPAYRMRESRFVPREHYTKAIERSRDFRESRSRDNSRAESPAAKLFESTTQDNVAQSKESAPFGFTQAAPNASESLDRQEGITQDELAPHTLSTNAKELPGSKLHEDAVLEHESAFPPNGLSNKTNSQTQATSFGAPSFGFASQAAAHKSLPSINFANHETQMSSQNPFLQSTVPDSFVGVGSIPDHPTPDEPQDVLDQSTVPNSFSSFGSKSSQTAQKSFANFGSPAKPPSQKEAPFPFQQPAAPSSFAGFGTQSTLGSQSGFGFASKPPILDASHDHTIQPSQIQASLQSSFGSTPGFGFKPINHDSPTPPQQNSYLPSQAISLLSDDDEDDTAEKPHASHLSYQHTAETEEEGEATGDLFADETSEDELSESYGHANPYAALANHGEEDGEEEGSEESHSQVENNGEYDSEQDESASDGEGYDGPNGYDHANEDVDDARNGYIDDEAEEDGSAADGDIDEETEDARDEDEQGSGYGYDDEDEQGLQTEEFEADTYAEYEAPSYGAPWMPLGAEKNSAMQQVGKTAEEAIELSD